VGGSREAEFGGVRLVLVRGDITAQDVEAIVNAANAGLAGGGGVDGAIHRAGGPDILRECRQIVATRGRLVAGDAVATTGGRLRAKFVIHAVGPIWHGGAKGEPGALARAYASSLAVARERKVRSIAFPSISTGAYSYPVDAAARVALATVRSELQAQPGELGEVRFVLFDERTLQVYAHALEELERGEGLSGLE
jgi:O-acetyl-ADP-ribose deacetylase